MKHAKQGLAALLLALVMTLGLGLVACGDKETTEYTVTFQSNGGSAVASVTVEENGKIEEPTAPTKANFVFGGWFKNAECTEAWVFATDTVQGDITLYAKWTPETPTAGTIAWVKPDAGSVVIPSDYGKYNPAYRKTIEELAPDVYATEDGERIATIVTAADELTYDENGMLTVGEYTVTYTARDSMGDDHEDTFDVKVVDAEESNYYVYAKTDRSGKAGVCGISFGAESLGGARVRVASDMFFEVTNVNELPEAIRNPYAEGKIRDYDDPFIIKNADAVELQLNTQDNMAEYTVFDANGVVTFGWNGANGMGIDENNKYALGKNGGINCETITVPAGGYVLIIGYTANGNWYGKVTSGKVVSVDDYWGTKADGAGVPQYDMDGRQFAATSFNYRLGNVVQLKHGNNVMTNNYQNQLPYILKGYDDMKVLTGTSLTEEMLKSGVEFWDDQATFAPDVQLGWDVVAIDFTNVDTAEEGTYKATYTVDDTQSDAKYTFERNIVVMQAPAKYISYTVNGTPEFVEYASILENPITAPSSNDEKNVTLITYTNQMVGAKLNNIQYSAAIVYGADGKVKAFVDANGGFYKAGVKVAGTYATNQLQCFKLNADDTAIADAYELQEGDILYTAYHTGAANNIRAFLHKFTGAINAQPDKTLPLTIVGDNE